MNDAVAPGPRSPSPGEREPGGPGHDDIVRAVLAASADGIVAVDERGVIRYCNPAATELFGRPVDELTGSDLGSPLAVGEATIDLVMPRGGSRVVDMRVTTTMFEGERLHVVALRDITRRRQAERELEEALERRNVVVAVAAHQLHNPLATIGLLVEVLRDRRAAAGAARRTEILARIAERVTHLQGLVRKLLTASRIDAHEARGTPERVPVLGFLIERLADLGERAESVRLSCGNGPRAYVDRVAFSEMLTNYLENALSYGRPPVEVRAEERDGERAEAWGEEGDEESGGRWVDITVRDHGPGVDSDFVPRLFERFSRAPAHERGTEGAGLGLWIVRNLARANGGDAWYEPRPDGACFRLRLPGAGKG
ncbi:ATP-binding protein [Streptomyces sp. NPDC003077]|uniref:sensor histidine kinase n=1 Tax=Streptomyces sp. NPDC003077 TaxID=3154443 RepID=UPI0033A156D5